MNRAAVTRIFNILVDIVFWLCMLLVTAVVLLVFVYAAFTIPSDSMMPTLQPGDRILVDKLSGGARLFDIFEAAQGHDTEIHRVPGWRRWRSGDVLVFNFPHRGSWDTVGMDFHKYFVKRCVGAPGDTVEIRKFVYYVNGERYNHGTPPAIMGAVFPSDSAARAARRGYMAFERDTIDNWTIRDLGPLYIPRKGVEIAVDTLNYLRYKKIIEWESRKRLEKTQDGLVLGGEPIDTYRFGENYYFMGGDYAVNSMDSRFWCLLPEPFVVGRAAFIWWSEDARGVRWDRVMKSLM